MNFLTLSLATAFCMSLGWSSEPFARFDCYPEPSGTEESCLQRGCLWEPSQSNHSAPSCYYPSNWGYSQQGPVIENNNGSEKVYQLVWNNMYTFPYPGGIGSVSLEVSRISHACVRLRYLNAMAQRYEVPISLNTKNEKDKNADIYNFSSQTSSSGLFGFDISRTNGDKEVVISSNNLPGVIHSNQFLQLLLSFPNQTHLYGWGERYSQVKIPTNKYTTLVSWSRDILDMPGYGNSYGVHPFLLGIEKNGNAFGILILNSNAMELVVTPYPALQYRTIGGIIDVFVFFGPSTEDVIRQYWNVIGFPVLPPFWSLGFHLSRWGYNTLNVTRQTVEGMIEAKVPYDTQWNDIDYMDEKKDFTYDKVNFSGLGEFVNELHEKYGMHYVMIVDPAISNASGYATYERGLADNVFITNENGQVLLGEVWPGVTAFPDFFKNSTQLWWNNEISLWYQVIPFDGLWIDMNEPSNFVTGAIGGCSENPLDNPPYFPTALLSNSGSTGLATKTLCMSAQQKDDKNSMSPVLFNHYDVHSLYGYTEAVSTFHALKQLQEEKDKRPFVLSRSTYCGSGNYTAHWLGDNSATFQDMQISISGILAFNLFGIPFVGADICGFIGNTTIELCTRWMQLGSFYPFSRNHNGYGYIPQDPASLGEPVTSVSRKYLSLRYQLLPYLYTLLYRSNQFGEVVIESIWLMDDWRTICLAEESCMSIESQFLWGKSLLISPALNANQTQVEAFFPALNNDNKHERWFELSTGIELPIFGNIANQWQLLDCPLDYLPLHIRGGYILPMQATQGPNTTLVGQTTTESRKNPFQLLAALDSGLRAVGEIFIDDGESQKSIENGKYVSNTFLLNCEKVEDEDEMYLCVLQSNITHSGFKEIANPLIDSVVIYGFHNEYFMPNVDWTNSDIDITFVSNNETLIDTEFNADNGVLRLTFFSNVTTITVTEPFFIAWTMTAPTNGGGNGDNGSSKNNTGLIVGIVIGVVLAVVLIIGVAYYMRHRKKHPQDGDYVSVHDSHPL